MIVAVAFKLASSSVAQTICDRVDPTGPTRSLVIAVNAFGGRSIAPVTYHNGVAYPRESISGGSPWYSVDEGEWYDLVIAHDGSTRWIWLNGLEVESQAIADDFDEVAGADEWLGCNYLTAQKFEGELALPFFSADALPTRAEAQALAYARMLYLLGPKPPVFVSGQGSIAVTATAALEAILSMSASGGFTFSATAAIESNTFVSGSGAVVFSGAAAAEGQGQLDGSGSLVVVATAQLSSLGDIEASGDIVLSASADLTAEAESWYDDWIVANSVDTDLVQLLEFDDGSYGDTDPADDTSSENNDGTYDDGGAGDITSETALRTGFANSLGLDGNQHAQADLTGVVDLDSDFTVGLLADADAFRGGGVALFTFTDGTDYIRVNMIDFGGGDHRLYLQAYDGTNNYNTNVAIGSTALDLHGYAIVRDGDDLKLFFDGTEVISHDLSAGWTASGGDMQYGRYATGPTGGLSGRLHHLGTWDVALSDALCEELSDPTTSL